MNKNLAVSMILSAALAKMKVPPRPSTSNSFLYAFAPNDNKEKGGMKGMDHEVESEEHLSSSVQKVSLYLTIVDPEDSEIAQWFLQTEWSGAYYH